MRTFFYGLTIFCAIIGFAFLILSLAAAFAAGGFFGNAIAGRPGAALGLLVAISPVANVATIAMGLALVPLALAIAYDRLGSP